MILGQRHYGNDTKYFKNSDYYYSKGASGVDLELKTMIQLKTWKNSLDFYASVKSLYLQDRQQKILNSKKIIIQMIVIGKKSTIKFKLWRSEKLS